MEFINCKFEILSEEDEEIDIEAIKQLPEYENYEAYTNGSIGANRVIINELTKAVKQLNKTLKGTK